MKPFQQGSLDSTCGLYAVVNATRLAISTLSHEMIHWTRHPSRLNRVGVLDDAAYAVEELVSEIGAMLLCSDLGIAQHLLHDHFAYINSWAPEISDRKTERNIIVIAVMQAHLAVRYLHSFQRGAPPISAVTVARG